MPLETPRSTPVTSAPPPPAVGAGEGTPSPAPDATPVCHHCGAPCPEHPPTLGDQVFCCRGCLTVFQLLAENGLSQYYELGGQSGLRITAAANPDRFRFLDDPDVRERLVDFAGDGRSRVTFRIPAIYCVACVWLLENLFRLHPGIGRSVVDFARREVAIWFSPGQLTLSELAALLASIGYEPSLTLGELDRRRPDPQRRRLHLQVGVAGFAFGNVMLFSLPLYLGLDSLSGPAFRMLFGFLSLALTLPVLLYSAADYFRSTWLSFRQRVFTLDVPIAAGLVALYAQSAWEILGGHGEGYLDSMAGLVFLLLCGRIFQSKTFDRLAFDADYRSFFPLAVTRRTGPAEETVALTALRVGDRLIVRNGELLPADARLVEGEARIDYSFVTGEGDPVHRQPGDRLYAGGRQVGGRIEIETVKPVSQSYLTSLWNHDTFRKEHRNPLDTLVNRYSRRFTLIVVGIALGSLAGWAAAGDAGRGLKAFTSVLIVACPCALALATPFALGTAHRLLARLGIFLKNIQVVERLAVVDTVVFDKTGTLTLAGAAGVRFIGTDAAPPDPETTAGLTALAAQSTHPCAVRLAANTDPAAAAELTGFVETPGRGIEGTFRGRHYLLGSRDWLAARGIEVPPLDLPGGSTVHAAADGTCRGAYVLAGTTRPGLASLVADLGDRVRLALLSGDNERERDHFARLFGPDTELRFGQSPVQKLDFIGGLRRQGRTVMMVGDGLNDAGALREADVGVAVVERAGLFSPASDLILEGARVPQLGRILDFARRSERIVKLTFAISALYNVIGVSIAATGLLSPLICAILMPVSSVTVAGVAWGATTLAARRTGLTNP